MANASYKKLRKNKIQTQLKQQQAKKVTEELRKQMVDMTDEQIDEMAKRLADVLTVSQSNMNEEEKGEEE